jgi:hypothetical protein
MTFVSEIWYGPDDCFKKNTGDSWTAMARIAYYDVLAHQLLERREAILTQPHNTAVKQLIGGKSFSDHNDEMLDHIRFDLLK